MIVRLAVARAMRRHRDLQPREGLLVGSASLLHWLLLIPFGLAALANLPGTLRLGPTSLQGITTIGQAALLGTALLWCRGYPGRVLLRSAPYLLFLVWAAVSPAWAPPSFRGVQNGIVYLLFGLCVILSGSLAARDPVGMHRLLERGIAWMNWVGLALVVGHVVLFGPAWEGQWLVGARSISLVGLLPFGWYLTRWYFGRPGAVLPLVLWLAAIISMTGRISLAIALGSIAVVVAMQLRYRPRRLAASVPLLAAAFATSLVLIFFFTPFTKRYFTGDTSIRVGSYEVNANGRLDFWRVTIESAMEKPVLGHGLGSSQDLIRPIFDRPEAPVAHPHNDYLRLWHDLGVPGAILMVGQLVIWLAVLFRRWMHNEKRREPPAETAAAAALALFALMVAMLTDNPIVYPFIMGPLGVLVGAGLGARAGGSTGIVPLRSRGLRFGAASRRAEVAPGRQPA